MSAAQIGLATAAAVTVQTTLAWSVGGTAMNLDLPLVVVVLAALSRGTLAGLWTGTAAGLAQDLLSGGIIGVSGLCKSVVGVAAGVAGQRLLVTATWQRALLLAVATFLHTACFFGAYALIPATIPIGVWSDVAVQAAANAVAGGIAIGIADSAGRWRQRMGHRRSGLTIGRWRAKHAP